MRRKENVWDHWNICFQRKLNVGWLGGGAGRGDRLFCWVTGRPRSKLLTSSTLLLHLVRCTNYFEWFFKNGEQKIGFFERMDKRPFSLADPLRSYDWIFLLHNVYPLQLIFSPYRSPLDQKSFNEKEKLITSNRDSIERK